MKEALDVCKIVIDSNASWCVTYRISKDISLTRLATSQVHLSNTNWILKSLGDVSPHTPLWNDALDVWPCCVHCVHVCLCVCVNIQSCDCLSLYTTHDLISAGSLFLAPPLFISQTAAGNHSCQRVCACVVGGDGVKLHCNTEVIKSEHFMSTWHESFFTFKFCCLAPYPSYHLFTSIYCFLHVNFI